MTTFFMTQHNYKLLAKVLDFSFEETVNTFQLDTFNINLDYFNKPQQHNMIFSNILATNLKKYGDILVIQPIKVAQQEWVRPVALPAYHIYQNCETLVMNFDNMRFPKSLVENRREEFRQYFLENEHKYGYKDNKIAPEVFFRKLIERFELDETENLRTLFESYKNSGEASYRATDKEEIDIPKLDKIKEKIDLFNQKIKEFLPEDIRKSYITLKDINKHELKEFEKKWLSSKNSEEQKKLKEIAELQRDISQSIVKYYASLMQNGIQLPEQMLQRAGFQKCRTCEKREIEEQMKKWF